MTSTLLTVSVRHSSLLLSEHELQQRRWVFSWRQGGHNLTCPELVL